MANRDFEERGGVLRQDSLPGLFAEHGQEVLESVAAVVVRIVARVHEHVPRVEHLGQARELTRGHAARDQRRARRRPEVRASLNVPFDSPDLAVAEIERFADDPRFVQVMVRGDTQSEWGDRKYWPVYKAAEAADFVAMCHVGGDPGNRYRGSGAPSYYLERNPRHLVQSIELAQMTDRVMFSSDYPNWDFDSPVKALPAAMPAGMRMKIMDENAARLYARRLSRD
jgi:predicted TIM-barrel fold metal-dependent hydrolase